MYYGADVEYGDFDNNSTYEYRLINDETSSITDYLNITHHYSCNSSNINDTCAKIRFYFGFNYYIELENGDLIEDALYKMSGNGNEEIKSRIVNQNYELNENDSSIKIAIENWFRTNLTNEENSTSINYQEYIEDTTYCNDRSFKTLTGNTSYPTYEASGWYKTGGGLQYDLLFGVFNRYNNNWYDTSNVPNLTCPNITDQFRVNNSQAPLNYPVGLLTVDEYILAGAKGNNGTADKNFYLNTGNGYWLMSAYSISGRYIYNFGIYGNGVLSSWEVNSSLGVRPVVSLKLGTEFEIGGNGTSTNPYIVKYN